MHGQPHISNRDIAITPNCYLRIATESIEVI